MEAMNGTNNSTDVMMMMNVTGGSGSGEMENTAIAKEAQVALGLGLSIGLYVLVCVLIPLLFYIIFILCKHDPCGCFAVQNEYSVNGNREGDGNSWKKKSAITTVSLELGSRGADHPPLYPMKQDVVVHAKQLPKIEEIEREVTTLTVTGSNVDQEQTNGVSVPQSPSDGTTVVIEPQPPSDGTTVVENVDQSTVQQFHV